MRISLRAAAAVTTSALLVLLTACSGESTGPEAGPPTGPTAVRTTSAASTTTAASTTSAASTTTAASTTSDAGTDTDTADFSVLAAVQQLPTSAVDAHHLWISTADLDAATEAAGLHRPTTLHELATTTWLGWVAGSVPMGDDGRYAPVYAAPPQLLWRSSQAEQVDQAIGWTALDVHSFVTSKIDADEFTVVSGDFTTSTLAPTLSPVSDGVVSFGDGADGTPGGPDASTLLNDIGVPVRFAERDGRIASSYSTARVTSWLAGPETDASSIGAVAAVARALDEGDVISAVISSPPSGNPLAGINPVTSNEQPTEAITSMSERGIAKPFDLIGIGWAAGTPDTADVRLVYHFAGGESDARAAVESVRHALDSGVSLTGKPFKSWFDVVNVRAQGDTVVATLADSTVDPVDTLVDSLYSGDVPFVYVPHSH